MNGMGSAFQSEALAGPAICFGWEDRYSTPYSEVENARHLAGAGCQKCGHLAIRATNLVPMIAGLGPV